MPLFLFYSYFKHMITLGASQYRLSTLNCNLGASK